MDSGIVCTYYSIDEAIENGASPIPISLDSTIDVQRTIDIMDHLPCIVCTYYSIDEAIENGASPIPISLDSTIDVQRTIDIMDHLPCDLFTIIV
ncbi:hypothetical protein V6N13_051820 [Hibiscus sabdariffa]